MHDLTPFLNTNEIDDIVQNLATQVSDDYKDNTDLARYISIPVTIDFIHASSYGSATASSVVVKFQNEKNLNIQNKDVLVVEDIVDTSLTLMNIIKYLKIL